MDRQAKLQEEQAAMAETLKNMQKKLKEEKSIFSLSLIQNALRIKSICMSFEGT